MIVRSPRPDAYYHALLTGGPGPTFSEAMDDYHRLTDSRLINSALSVSGLGQRFARRRR